MTDLAALPELPEKITGGVAGPLDAGYDEARGVHNAMIDRRPALLARCATVAEVQAVLDTGRRSGLPVAVRGGGHSGPGFGTVDGGIVIDLSPMHAVAVDPRRRTATVQGGATWRAVDAATHEHGLATPSGIISSTGVGGLTLGGGHGYLSRRHGLAIDNLVEAEVVLADGTIVRASKDQHPDLFWALRGGGGNFGIVTSFTFRLHPVRNVIVADLRHGRRPEVVPGLPPCPGRRPLRLLRRHDHPPVDAFPEAFHLHKACAVMWCYLGDPAEAEEAFAPVRAMQPAFDGIGEAPYPGLQSAFDGLYPKGLQWYRRRGLRELHDGR